MTAESVDVGGFRDVDATKDPAGFVRYMDAAHQYAAQRAWPLLALRLGETVLDVGCGPGNDLRALAASTGPAGLAVGVDRSMTMAAEAHDRAGTAVVQSVGSVLPFRSASFDACLVQAVLLHTPDPQQTVAEVARVLKRGGRLLVGEPDHESHIVATTELDTYRRLKEFRYGTFVNPTIGRQLRGLLHRSGFDRIEVRAVPIVVTTYAEMQDRIPYTRLCEQAVGAGAVDQRDADRFLASLQQADEEGSFFFAGLSILTIGVRA